MKQLANIAGVLLLLLPLAWLRYPILYQDTAAYVHGGFIDLVNGLGFDIRSPLYAYSIRLLTQGLSLYPVVVTQAFLAWYAMDRALSLLPGLDAAQKLLLVALLALFSTLPWYVCLVMPDIFTGLVPLLLFFLLETGRFPLGIGLLCVASVLMHNSNLLTAPLTVLGCLPLYARGRDHAFRRFWGPALALLLPVLLLGSFQRFRTGTFQLSELGAGTFLVNRWINDRVLSPFLEQICTDPSPLVACRHRREFTRTQVDGYWNDSAYILDLGGFKAAQNELGWLTRTFVRQRPLTVAADSLANAARQSVTVGVPLWDFSRGSDPWKYDLLFSIFRRDAPFFERSRLHDASVRESVSALMRLDTVLLYGLAALAAAICLGWREERLGPARRFFLLTALYYVLNIWLCATVSGPFERFAGRVSWTVLLSSLALVVRFLSTRKKAPLPFPAATRP